MAATCPSPPGAQRPRTFSTLWRRFRSRHTAPDGAVSVSAQTRNASHNNGAQEERGSPPPLTAAQAEAAANMRRLERLICEVWGIGPEPTQEASRANTKPKPKPTPERAFLPPGFTSTPTPEQRANYELQAAEMQNFFAAFGVDWKAPPPPWQTSAPNAEGDETGTVMVQTADGTRAVPIPVHVPTDGRVMG